MANSQKKSRITIAWILVISMLVPMFSFVSTTRASKTSVPDNQNYDAMSIEEIMDLGDSLTWVFTGDSITHNTHFTMGMNGHADWFEQYIKDIPKRQSDKVVNSAWGGAQIQDFQTEENTPDGQGSKEDKGQGVRNYVTQYNPDVVFIKLGMNNRGTTKSDFVKYYKQMLDAIYDICATEYGKRPKIILLSPTPMVGENLYDDKVNPEPQRLFADSTLNRTNDIREIAEEYDLIFCDLRNAFLEEQLVLGADYRHTFFHDSSDGTVHPNAAGQYFMFKTWSQTLGIYDESNPIYQIEYDDINSVALYTDDTYNVTYDNEYGNVSGGGEMDKEMPTLPEAEGTKLIASVDFDADNGEGVFAGTSTKADKVSLTNANICDDTLTLKEAKNLGKEFSVVFRAKLESPAKRYQTVFYLSDAETGDNWKTGVAVGVPGTKHELFYASEQYANLTPSRTSGLLAVTTGDSVAGDSTWHTIALVQSDSQFTYYVDGTVVYQDNTTLLGSIGSKLAGAEDIVAHIGASATDDLGYNLEGSMDYFQLYNGALTQTQVQKLVDASNADAQEMNKTMPTLITAHKNNVIASVDFSSTTGIFNGTTDYATSTRFDLTDETKCNDALTLSEVQNLDKEFSVVFRAKLNNDLGNNYQSILWMADANESAPTYKDGIALGVPEAKDYLFYSVHQYDGLTPARKSNMLQSAKNIAGDGKWHTVAIVQTTAALTYYVDGEAVAIKYKNSSNQWVSDTATHLKNNIGSYFENATGLTAYIGSLVADTTGSANKANLNGLMDYYQLYNCALSEDEVQSLLPTIVTQPTEKKPTLLASVDFDSTNGTFRGSDDYNTSTRVSLTDYIICDDTLTLKEAQNMGTEFSVIFRAKLNKTAQNYQSILWMSDAEKSSNYKDGVALGVPSKDNYLFYSVKQYEGLTPARKSNMLKPTGTNIAGDGEWHTIAMVQSNTALTYYIDGEAVAIQYRNSNSDWVEDTGTHLTNEIGSYFTDVDELTAYIGSCASGTGGDANKKNLNASMDFYQLYDGALSAKQVKALSPANESQTLPSTSWADTVAENSVWMVAGAEQMSGYEGSVVNRSMFRMIDNAIRFKEVHRDVRMWDAAVAGYTVEKLNEEYDEIIGDYIHNVFLLLPEISQVYAEGYTHSDTAVAAYKASVQELLKKEKDAGNVRILWTPLATNDAIINGYLSDYAKAIREIAKEDNSILFFDANRFMNENMKGNESLSCNWFEEDMRISPLCSTDLVQAFFVLLTTQVKSTNTGIAETKEHNLRYTSDIRVFKGDYVRDYLEPNNVSVNGEAVTVDITDIKTKYALDSVRFAVMPDAATGNYHKDIYDIGNVSVSGNKYTFAAPCSNPIIAVYGKVGDITYRFKDFKVAVTTSQDLTNTTPNPDGVYLEGLQVVGAPDIGYDKEKLSYDVDLYQYQSSVQILATAQEGLKITVNEKEVESAKNSHLIEVSDNSTVEVVVTDTVHTDRQSVTYTLNLSKPEYPDIIITEIMQDGYYTSKNGGGDRYDLIEIYNASGKDLNLLDYSIGYKKDFRKTEGNIEYQYPNYYFTGNNEAFQSDNKDIAEVERPETYTGINQITKYSSYWDDGSVTEPSEVTFKADSTMVIWVLAAGKGSTPQEAEAFGKALSYDTLIQTLKDNKDTNVLSVDGEAVVPAKEQLVVAEIPKGTETESLLGIARSTAEESTDHFYLDNHIGDNETNSPNARKWLFVLKNTASQATNGAITEAGDDIISAARTIRLGGMKNLSNVLSYNTERGMSLVKNEGFYDDENFSTTSDVQGYGNKTTFGAVEYWQKPADSNDNIVPTVQNNTTETVFQGGQAEINLTLTDNEDVRYLELYIRQAGETEFTKMTKDFVLEAGMKNGGVSTDITSADYICVLEEITGSVEYYGFVVDGNQNKTKIGSDTTPLKIQYVVPGTLNINMSVLDEEGNAVADQIATEVTIRVEKGTASTNLKDTYDVMDETKTKVGTLTLVNGTLTGIVPFENSGKLSVAGLPEGAKYTVSMTVPEGYLTDKASYTATVDYAVAANVSLTLQERRNGDLQISMSVTDDKGAKTKSVANSVKIVLTGDELSGTYKIVNQDGAKLGSIQADSKTGTITMKDGDSAYIKDLPPAIGYTITVANPKGYVNQTEVTEYIGSIKKGRQTEVTLKVVAGDGETGLASFTNTGSADSGEGVNTGDSNLSMLWLVLIVVSLGAGYFSKRKMSKK